MKSISITLTFILSGLFSNAATLNIDIFNCKTDPSSYYEIKVYKDNSYLTTLHLDYLKKLDTTLLNLDLGTYYFEFETIFKTTVSDTLELKKDTLYNKSICVDDIKYLPPTFKTYLDSLKDDQFFYINFETYGCFHWELTKLKVSKSKSSYYATLYPTKKVREHYTVSGKPKTRKLNDSISKQIKEFEEFMDDDFSSAKVLANMFEIAPVINSIKDGLIPADAISGTTLLLVKEKFKIFLEDIFGLQSVEGSNNKTVKGIMQLLIDIRKASKNKKDYATSDKIRNQLSELGILLKDEKDGGMSWGIE